MTNSRLPPINTRVLGFDLGGSVGWCFSFKEKGCWDLPRGPGTMMVEFEGKLRALIDRYDPEVITVERPLIPFGVQSKNTGKHAFTQFGQAAAIARLCHDANVIMTAIPVQSARKDVFGRAKIEPETIREELGEMHNALNLVDNNSHIDDAIVVWLCSQIRLERGQLDTYRP